MKKAEFLALSKTPEFRTAFAKDPVQALTDNGIDIAELPVELLDKLNAAGRRADAHDASDETNKEIIGSVFEDVGELFE